ncbi:hypothetical protein [Maioricimonas sp. JC845]|uniref:hypothetical protein n=1 Tax=Maioricimonas sp. JC845 TaxID=3232138 RepID=UPI003458DF1B
MSADAGGVYVYSPGEWGVLHLHLVNREEEPVEILCTSYFDHEPTLQYGRRVWLPPRSRLRTWHPIRVPELDNPDQATLPFHTQVTLQDGTRDVLLKDEIGKVQSSGDLRLFRERYTTGLVAPVSSEADEKVPPFDLVMIGRLDQQLPRRLTMLGDRVLPADDSGLATFDQLIIADDRMLDDAAAMGTIRRWLYSGGNLWIMLDRVDPELLSVLLGDESGCSVVDTVTLTDVTIENGPAGRDVGTHHAEYEEPLEFVRVILDDEQVPLEVNGWPAAFWKDCGAGRLLVTTLESPGWVRPRQQNARRSGDDSTAMPYEPVPPFRELMAEFFLVTNEAQPTTEALDSYVREYVGYEVPSRGLVAGLLAGFVCLFGGVGFWLMRVGRLELLAIVGPVAAVITATTLMGIGRQQRQTVPPTTAILQLVQPVPGTDDVLVSGAAGLYHPASSQTELGGTSGGWIEPELEGTGGTIRRMIWSDLDQWQWENLPAAPALQTARLQVALEQSGRLAARAGFGPDGLTGRLETPEAVVPEDAVLVTSGGRIGVNLLGENRFEIPSTAVLETDQFLQDGLLSDEQVRRGHVLNDILDRGRRSSLALDPVLYFWSKPWETGLQFGSEGNRVGAALVAVPLELQRPPAGTHVSLPSPLLVYRERIGPDGHLPTGLYDYRSGEWTAKSAPAIAWLRVDVPEELLPVSAESGRIIVRVSGPVGRLELAVARDTEPVPLKTWIDPVGTVALDLDASDLSGLAATGSLMLRVSGGDPDRPELTNPDPDGTGKVSYWQIDSLDVQLEAVVQPRESQDAPPQARTSR